MRVSTGLQHARARTDAHTSRSRAVTVFMAMVVMVTITAVAFSPVMTVVASGVGIRYRGVVCHT